MVRLSGFRRSIEDMRVEPYSVGSFLHVVKRGARGMNITGDVHDQRRFLRLLYFMNDLFFNEDWEEQVEGRDFGYRPEHWPQRKPLTSVLAYTLMPNHFHLVLKETRERGISRFMQKIGQSMTEHFNLKYDQHGSIFQGSYRSRTIGDDIYFRYVTAYVAVKNTFELYPRGGLRSAQRDFEKAWKWGIAYQFSSLRSYLAPESDPLLDPEAISEMLPVGAAFKTFSRDVIRGGKWTNGEFE